MITVTHIDGNIIKIKVDSSKEWEDFSGAKEHLEFVKTHHQKVEKIAFVAGHMWQHWVAAMASIFVHPKIKVFEKSKLEDAESWIRQ